MDSGEDVLYNVLVVDDEPQVRGLIEGFLKPYSFDLDFYGSVEGARDSDFDSVDVVISDYEIGLENGDDLYDEVRRDSNVPFIFFTTRDTEYVETDIESDDNTYHLEKTPGNYEKLGEFIEEKLEEQ